MSGSGEHLGDMVVLLCGESEALELCHCSDTSGFYSSSGEMGSLTFMPYQLGEGTHGVDRGCLPPYSSLFPPTLGLKILPLSPYPHPRHQVPSPCSVWAREEGIH